jgi:hypothetical protein
MLFRFRSVLFNFREFLNVNNACTKTFHECINVSKKYDIYYILYALMMFRNSLRMIKTDRNMSDL